MQPAIPPAAAVGRNAATTRRVERGAAGRGGEAVSSEVDVQASATAPILPARPTAAGRGAAPFGVLRVCGLSKIGPKARTEARRLRTADAPNGLRHIAAPRAHPRAGVRAGRKRDVVTASPSVSALWGNVVTARAAADGKMKSVGIREAKAHFSELVFLVYGRIPAGCRSRKGSMHGIEEVVGSIPSGSTIQYRQTDAVSG